MSRPRKFTPQTEADIAKRRAAGESTTSIAASLGTSSQNIDNSLKRSASGIGAGGAQVAPSLDPFEAAQMQVFERLKLELEVGDHNAQGLSQLTKALNDTVKAIRQHRVLTKAVERDQAPRSQAAEMVRQRLEKLSKTQRMAVAVFESLTEQTDADKTGTE